MNIIETTQDAFQIPLSHKAPSEAFIIANPNIMEIQGNTDLLTFVPAYMLSCLNNASSQTLVSDFTIWALAEYGRCKSPETPHLNFKYLCNEAQTKAVVRFLVWCQNNMPFADANRIERALRHWQQAADNFTPNHHP